MSRINTMARFNEDIPEYHPLTFCYSCSEELYEGEDVVKFDNEYFCNTDCFLQHMDIKEEPLQNDYFIH